MDACTAVTVPRLHGITRGLGYPAGLTVAVLSHLHTYNNSAGPRHSAQESIRQHDARPNMKNVGMCERQTMCSLQHKNKKEIVVMSGFTRHVVLTLLIWNESGGAI